MKILVTGASGLIGKNFIRKALGAGHQVHALVRNPSAFRLLPPSQVFRWDHQEVPPFAAFDGVDAILHLAGESVAGSRWTAKQKAKITSSRLTGTKNLVTALAQIPEGQRPKILLSGSAIGFYGYSPKGIADEKSPAGHDFLADLCVRWESEALRAEALGLRVVLVRTGIVLSREGGALAQMPPVRIGSGKNWMSWIHMEDMIGGLLFALDNMNVKGPVNFVSPNPAQGRDFARELAQVFRLPAPGYVPALIVRAALGEAANVVLSDLRATPKALLDFGYVFKVEDLGEAIKREYSGNHILDRYFFRDQFVPLTPEEIFPYFSRAENLEELTPPWLNFRIIAKSTEDVQVGTLIDYSLKVHGVPVGWRTRISEWKENEYFVDDQLKGPYSKWHHLHTFEKVPGGCLLRDEVTYRVPASIFGRAFLDRWIAKDVNQIFSYRQNQIQDFIARGVLGAKGAGAR